MDHSDIKKFLSQRYTKIRHKTNTKQIQRPKRKLFFKWALNNKILLNLHACYVASGFLLKNMPVCARINPDLGYNLNNMNWITYSELMTKNNIMRKRFK